MLRMRTMAEAYEEIKRADPDTAITKTYIRRLIVTGTVPSIQAGKKYLVNMDVLENYLSNAGQAKTETVTYGKIRAIAE